MLSFINCLTKTLAPNLAVLLALPMGFEEFSCVTPLKQKENTHPHNDLKTATTRKVNHYFWRLVMWLQTEWNLMSWTHNSYLTIIHKHSPTSVAFWTSKLISKCSHLGLASLWCFVLTLPGFASDRAVCEQWNYTRTRSWGTEIRS